MLRRQLRKKLSRTTTLPRSRRHAPRIVPWEVRPRVWMADDGRGDVTSTRPHRPASQGEGRSFALQSAPSRTRGGLQDPDVSGSVAEQSRPRRKGQRSLGRQPCQGVGDADPRKEAQRERRTAPFQFSGPPAAVSLAARRPRQPVQRQPRGARPAERPAGRSARIRGGRIAPTRLRQPCRAGPD